PRSGTVWPLRDDSRFPPPAKRGHPSTREQVTANRNLSLPTRNGGRKKGTLTVENGPVLPRLGIDSPRSLSGAFREKPLAASSPPAGDVVNESAGAPVGALSRDSRTAGSP